MTIMGDSGIIKLLYCRRMAFIVYHCCGKELAMKKKIIQSLILVLVLALTGIYALPGLFASVDSSSDVATADASFNLDKEQVLEQLKAQNIDAINKDLIQRVDEQKLTGTVSVIVTLSDGSLVGQYNNSSKTQTLQQYISDEEAQTAVKQVRARQDALETQLVNEGLISKAKYHYNNIMDGFAATTTYENLAKLVSHSGVYRVMICNSYLPQDVVVNDVNVYDTGIFKNDVSDKYTGKGTVVAILDTGCDYAHPAFTTHQVQGPKYDRSDIENILNTKDLMAEQSSGGRLEAREVYYGHLTKGKIVYGYDYADKDTDIMPFLSEHGTHVAGIIGGYAETPIFNVNDDFEGDRSTTLVGVAADTQFAIMKVFSDSRQGAYDEDILAALEDCVALNVDAINMSLGSSCGFSREADDDQKNAIYDNIEAAGISLLVAASNDYSSAQGSEFGNTNKVENPDSATVGAPSTYTSALSVASVNGNKDKFLQADGREIFFIEAYDQNSKEYNFFEKLGVTGNKDFQFEYVTVPGLGSQVNYMGLNVRGKIALVKRGDINFEDKVLFAQAAGAIGVIIYNNVYGDILMTVGNDCEIGVVSIGKDEGEYLASKPNGTITLNASNTAGPFMSDFSSWGPNPDLTIKPEITAHGGNIWSSIPGGGYEKLSGTSMATPNLCGIAVLLRQYVNDTFPNESVVSKRNLVNQLLMSTATIALNQEGNPYSPRKQGAGIADIKHATTTPAYIVTYQNDLKTHQLVQKDGKNVEMSTSKLELGDDPARTGEYKMTFKVVNISNAPVTYKLGNYTFTESVSADKKYVAEKAYMLSHSVQYAVNGSASADGMVTVPAGQSVEVSVQINLSKQDRTYLNDTFPNGMYVEGFVTLDNQAGGESVDLHVPFLAFYGDWQDAPIFDKDYYEVETTAHNNAIDDEDKVKADYYATTPFALYYYDYIIPMGTYLYDVPYGYNPIPATEEHAALSYQPTSLSGIYAVYAGLLRCAKELNVEIVNASTGDVVWSMTDFNCYKAHYSGGPQPYVCEFELPMFDLSSDSNLTIDGDGIINGAFGQNNDRFIVNMKARLDWKEGERNVNDVYSFSFYIDTEAPTVTGTNFRTKYNETTRKMEYYLDLEVYDNHYAMGVRPIVINWATDENDNPVYSEQNPDQQMIAVQSLSDNAFPVYQTARGTTTVVEIEITDYLDRISNSLMPHSILFQLDDYALNTNLLCIPLPETENGELVFGEYSGETLTPKTELNIDLGQTVDISKLVVGKTAQVDSKLNKDYLFMLPFNSSAPDVAPVHNGVVEGLATGTAQISFEAGGVTQTLTVNVSDKQYTGKNDNKNSRDATLEEIRFVGYRTLRAFNSEIDRSEIGDPGDDNYFEAGAAISFYPSEKVKLRYQIKPWNLESQRIVYKTDENGNYLDKDGQPITTKNANGTLSYIAGKSEKDRDVEKAGRYDLTWRTTDPRVAIVDNEGYVTAIAEGNCSVILTITVDGRVSVLQARCNVNVKSEFVIESRYLIAYKGMGKDYHGEDPDQLVKDGTPIVVEIPDDEGLMYINSYAFSYYNMDNAKEVDDKYDIDAKRSPIGNRWISEVVVPEYILGIENYAFWNCTNLKKVTLPEKLATIGKGAFFNCTKLESINLDNVNMINDGAFQDCRSLTDVGESKLAHPYALGTSAFQGCTSLKEIELTNLRRGGVRSFMGCTGLTKITFGESTRLAESMFEGCTGITRTKGSPLVVNSDQVPDRAFYGCEKLVAVKFTKDISYFGANAFRNCYNLEQVTFDGACEEFASNVFYGCNKLSSFKLGSFEAVDGVVYNSDKTELLYAVPSLFKQTDFVLPKTVRSIASGAFSATGIRSFSVEADSALTTIGNNAFAYCSNLTSVTLPATVTSIGRGAFAATGIHELDLSALHINLPEEVLQGSSVVTVTLPTGCTEIGDNAFSGCTSLQTVNGLQDVKVIGSGAFRGAGLTSATLGDGVTVGSYAFAGQFTTRVDDNDIVQVVASTPSALTSVTFAGKVYVGDYAFANTSLSSLTISATGSTVGNYGFAYNLGIGEINADGVVGKLGDYAFAYCSQIVGSSSAAGIGEVSINGVEELGTGAFAENIVLQTVHSQSLKKVGDEAFYPLQGVYYNHLTDIDLGNVVEIGDRAFPLCRSLANVNLSKVQTIGNSAFEACESLVQLALPVCTSIGENAFGGCSSLTLLTVPNVEHIGANAFAGTALTTLALNPNLKTIGDAIVYGANNFTGFTANGQSSGSFGSFVINEGVLYSKHSDGTYTLISYPTAKRNSSYKVLEDTTRIGLHAAAGNRYLQEVTLPSSLKSIGDYAFYNCRSLTKVNFRSYYAPRLESAANVVEQIRLNAPEDPSEEYMTARDFPYFDELYRYDFYYRFQEAGEISYFYGNYFAYRQFGSIVGQKKLTMQVPANSSGYDNFIYKVYFDEQKDANGNVVKGERTTDNFAQQFMDAVKALQKLGKIDRFASKQMEEAVTAFNLMKAAGSMYEVYEEYFNAYNEMLMQYNVDVARNALGKLFEMADTPSSYKLLKQAYDLYNGLSADEKTMLDEALGKSAKTLLDSKIAEYTQAVGGGRVDLGKSWPERVLDLLDQLLGGVGTDQLTEQHFAKLQQAQALIKTLSDDERDEYISRLTPYLNLIDAWNNYADTSDIVSAANAVSDSFGGKLLVAVAGLNALLAAAYVAFKGGIL